MISFQQPIDILNLRKQLMVEDAAKISQQKEYQNDLLNGLTQIAGAYADYKDNKDKFMGAYNFLQEKNLLSPDADEQIQGFVSRGNFGAANAYMAPYLSELDFGRKAMLSGRSGFFDSQGQWQMAMPAQSVEPRNKSGYRVGGTR